MFSCQICRDPIPLGDRPPDTSLFSWVTGGAFLCSLCQSKIISLRCPSSSIALAHLGEVYTLVDYREPVVKLIHNAKIGNDQHCYRYLTTTLLKDLEFSSQDLPHPIDYVVAVPSSLWGRLHSRFDLAYGLAQSLADILNVPLLSSPWRYGWYLKKRAQQNQKQSFKIKTLTLDATENDNDVPRERVLIVDDIITTGYSLQSFAHTMPGKDLVFWALANAYKSGG